MTPDPNTQSLLTIQQMAARLGQPYGRVQYVVCRALALAPRARVGALGYYSQTTYRQAAVWIERIERKHAHAAASRAQAERLAAHPEPVNESPREQRA